MLQKGRGKGKGKGKGPELTFDEKARAEYLTGFRKRKQERKQAGREYLAKKAKEEQLVARKELRQARKEKAAENVREARKAYGLEAEGESDLDADDASDDEQPDQADAVPQIQEEEYDSDQHHTHVVVESFDPEQEAFAKAIENAPTTRIPKANGPSQEKDHPHQEKDVAQKRLLVSGLTESFSKEELVRRFSTFGSVLALDGLGKRDALGQFRPYAYLTLRAPQQQIQRCMNLLSGSVWKGATLRIGEAKPDFQQRIQQENEKQRLEDQQRTAKVPRRLPPGMGFESARMEPVDEAAVESGSVWGWKRTPAGHLVRPLRMRPAHPLPRPSRASTLAHANANANVQQEDAQPESSRVTRVNPRPPTKAHRITIDPTRYGAIHLSGPLLESLAAETGAAEAGFDVASLGSGEWQCEEIDDGAADASHRLVCWRYVAKDGVVLHEEFTRLPVRVVAAAHARNEEDVVDQLDFDRFANDADGDLFAGFSSTLTPAKPAAHAHVVEPAAVAAEEVDTADIDDLFSGLTSSAAGTNDLFSDLPPVPAKRAKVQTPAASVPAPAAPISTPTPKTKGTFVPGLDPEEEDAANFSDGYDETTAATPAAKMADAVEERQKTLALLGEMFGASDDEVAPAVVAAQEEEVEQESESGESSSDASIIGSSSEVEDVEATPSSDSSPSSDAASEVELPDATDAEVKDVAMEDAAAVDEVVPAAMDGKSRRAAFLRSLATPAGSTQASGGSYVPIARFDPASLAPSMPQESTPVAAEVQPARAVTASATGEDVGSKVSMSTLKEMFRPQEPTASAGFSLGLDVKDDSGAGFSLLDSLGLDLELEEEPLDDTPPPTLAPIQTRYPASEVVHQQDEPKRLAPFFPSTAEAAWNGPNAQAAVLRWMRPRTEEQRQDDWSRYKQSLTPAVKKRHREAARKHKRNFKSLPHQQPNAEANTTARRV
ncbi:hypothetical protein PaG_00188 [Moesziomyces aphidis]|uniref:RRM domain-containing protein n=1 Tax=Moesziomyces aphidis TaxID=84754 RepID=W3VUE3_MOEAP|nr:hypothetical protein PaG_00188 [Moesziomyces aphidis]